MALIIELSRVHDYEPDIADATPRREYQTAEVILFPGVRYEHWLDGQERGGQCAERSAEADAVTVNRDWLKV